MSNWIRYNPDNHTTGWFNVETTGGAIYKTVWLTEGYFHMSATKRINGETVVKVQELK